MVARAPTFTQRRALTHLAILDAPMPVGADGKPCFADPKVWHFAFRMEADLPERLIYGRVNLCRNQVYRLPAPAPKQQHVSVLTKRPRGLPGTYSARQITPNSLQKSAPDNLRTYTVSFRINWHNLLRVIRHNRILLRGMFCEILGMACSIEGKKWSEYLRGSAS
jgi:hypothetical protein